MVEHFTDMYTISSMGTYLTLLVEGYVTCAFAQWRGERYDGTSPRTGSLQSKKIKNRMERYCQKINKNISYYKGMMLWQFWPPMSALGLQDS